jgi:hypothetical protein
MPSDSDVTLVSDDEGPVPGSSDNFPVTGSSPGDTAVRNKNALLGSSEEVTAAEPDSDSDFELTPSSVIDALQPESGSDFELTALDASDEFEATPLHGPSDSDVTAAEPAASGINLARPSDSGINLQGVGGGLNLGQAESIELAPLDDEPKMRGQNLAKPTKPSKPSPAATPLPPKKAEKAEKDIFEDTDFEVDALDTDQHDKTMQLDAASDYDLEDDSSDSGSEVFAVDEEDVDQNAATAMAPGVIDDDSDEEDFDENREMPSSWDVESETTDSGRTAAPTMLAPSGPSAEWGGVWVGMLGVATVFILILSFVSMDLVRNLYDYRGATPVASGMIKGISDMMGGSK